MFEASATGKGLRDNKGHAIPPGSPLADTNFTSPNFLDFSWDTMRHEKREQLALEQAKATAIFAKAYVPFYGWFFRHLSENNIADIDSIEEFSCTLPETTKKHLSGNPYHSFLPATEDTERDLNKGRFRNKGTGGTTAQPVSIFYSVRDWRAMAQHIARSIKFDFRDHPEDLKNLVVLGLYHGDHVTNEIYQAGLTLLGAEFVDRVSTKADVVANYEHFKHVRPSAILAPPEDASNRQTKGITLDKLLQLDARHTSRSSYRMNHRANPNFRAIFWSSMPMSEDLQDYLTNHLGVPYQQGQYGSTEVCPTGATCSQFPRDFHLGYGPSLVAVKRHTGDGLVDDGEVGYVLASKTGATRADGSTTVPTGTTLINFRTGDFATLKNTKGHSCDCGRNTPVLHGVHRAQYKASKRMFGCQAD